MAGVEWRRAPQLVLDIANRLIEQHHPDLLDCRVGFLLRSEAPKRGFGMSTYGKAKKVSDEMKTILPFDFIIWLAEDVFSRLSAHQREALIDHELTHCVWNEKKQTAKLRPHDFEEFNSIVHRYGAWWPDSDATLVAFQNGAQLEMDLHRERRGRVGAVEVDGLTAEVAQAFEDAGILDK